MPLCHVYIYPGRSQLPRTGDTGTPREIKESQGFLQAANESEMHAET